ncbi:NUDIX hydrolase [Clostridiaceae bacterium M8S5]|nr:NUDIX hydrolase [Clostridiaceae bacterium M8S5]
MSKDILFKTEENVFSYRVAGILIIDNKILLQKPKHDNDYSIPGGHVNFGETSDEALVREFKEEINADIKIDKLIMVGENFFPWGDRPCQQISLYYVVSLCEEDQIPLDGTFKAIDELGDIRVNLDFCWIPLSKLDDIVVCPANIKQYLFSLPEEIKHFVYKEK